MSTTYLACAAVVAIALVVTGHVWWRRGLYVLAVLSAAGSAAAVFCLIAGGMLVMAGVP
ncbi:hypothetical protein AB0C10_21515 [Microbispora amethystogenes]|uniref:hypothetical protein n=1 Tax=Microbispora amethystogenes TaxID=1427754 RepID=UPI0033C1879D